MCITRVGKVVSIYKSKATVMLVGDDRIVENIDVSMIDAKPNSYIEVYANLALATLSIREANQRKRAWLEVMRSRN
jgi:hydrogenase maturation factor